MGQGSYVICEWDSIQETFPQYEAAVRKLDSDIISKCEAEWAPKKIGYLTPDANEFGRTTILPALFRGFNTLQMAHWRQNLTLTGHQLLIYGAGSGATLAEDFKVGWMGLAFPNKQQLISEIRWQLGDRKYGRINIEEIERYNKPALVFEEGFIIDEETSFDLYGYVKTADYQRIVMLGAAYFKFIDKVLGLPGAVIPSP